MRESLMILISTLSLLSCFSRVDPRLNVDEKLEMPAYKVITAEGNCELREYPPHIIASVKIKEDFSSAGRQGFRALAGYIFGGNTSKTSISMTAPVSMSPAVQGESISMTAPVTSTPSGARSWEIAFAMPSQYTLDTLPTPKDPRVKLSERPSERVAVVVFSGFTSESNLSSQEALLKRWVEARSLQLDGPIVIARYNDPFTFPWNRRNELIVKVRSAL